MQVIQVPQTLFLIFTIAVVLSVVIQAGVFLGLFFVAKIAAAKAEKIANDASARALPIITQTRTIVEDLTPKLRVITANLVEISTTLRDQTKHVNSTVGEVVDKTRQQAERVDEMVSAILDGVTHAGATIQAGVSVPARKVTGIFNGLRAAAGSFNRKKPHTASTTATAYPQGAAPSDYREPVVPTSTY